MKNDSGQVLCRFHVSTDVKHGMTPLYEWIVHAARREGLQGATVLKGMHGLARDGTVLHERPWAVVQRLPVIVEIVDRAARIEQLLSIVEPVLQDGVVTLERARVLLYRAGPTSGASPAGRVAEARLPADETAAREVRTMNVPEDGVLLRIFIGESDREAIGDRPLYEAIVRRAREAHLAGATVLRGPMGFGRHSRVHAAKLLELSTDLPVVIEIVDAREKIERFLPVVDALVTEGLVTIEAVRVLKYASPDNR